MNFADSTTYAMVRALNVILSNATDEEVEPYVKVHAYPRVRFKLLTATDTLGRNVFYGRITDLSDPTLQRAAEILLDRVLNTEVVAEGLRAIIARFACAAMTARLAAQLDPQRDYAKMLEKQAEKDLEDFIRSPVLGGVVTAVRASVSENLQARSFGLSLDGDPATYAPAYSTASPYIGAQAAGEVRVYFDGTPITIPVALNDTPAQILRKLSLKSIQLAGLRQVELISMDKDNPPKAGERVIVVNNTNQTAKVIGHVVEATLQNRQSSAAIASLVSVSLVHTVNNVLRPGLAGLLVGYGNDYNLASSTQNPVILADIRNSDFIMPMDPSISFHPSDIMCFKVNTGSGTLSALKANNSANVVKYKISQVITGGQSNTPARVNAEVTIPVQNGWTALNVVEAIAQDLGRKRAMQQVLGAVLPSIKVTDVAGVVHYVPAIDLVGFSTDPEIDMKFLFQITELPEGVDTALATRAYNAQSFDPDVDSVVVSAITLGRTESVTLDAGGQGHAKAVDANSSKQMRDALAKIRRMLDSGR